MGPMVGRGRTTHPTPPRPPNSSCGPACTVLHQSHPRPRCQELRHLAGTQTGSVEAVLSLPLPRGPRGLASLLGLPSPGDSRQVLPSAPQTPPQWYCPPLARRGQWTRIPQSSNAASAGPYPPLYLLCDHLPMTHHRVAPPAL